MSHDDDYWIGYSDLSRHVYHYTSLTSGLLILASKRLRFSPIANVNDPVECERRVAWSTQHKITRDKCQQASKTARELLYDKTVVLCCSTDNSELEHYKLQSEQTDQTDSNPSAVAPFRDKVEDRGFYRMRMWAQYAGNHTGVCIVLNREVLNANVEKSHPSVEHHEGQVQYGVLHNCNSSNPYSLCWKEYEEGGIEKAVSCHLRRNWQAEYFFKRMDWRDEREYRWVLRGVKSLPAYVGIDGAMEAVILGCEFDRECEESIRYLAGDDTPVYHFKPTIGAKVLSLLD